MKKQMVSFLIIGIINTIFYYVVYSSLIYVNLNYKWAVLIATVTGVLFSFNTFGKYVFNNSNKALIYKFFIVYSILYVCNISIIYFIEIKIKSYYIAGFIATLFCAMLSFVLNKWYVFKEKKGN
jgi:putative flippase GtrA